MKSLVLIPSDTEHELFRESINDRWPTHREVAVEVCGVGLVASAIGTTVLLNRIQPDQVFLLGIAGLLNAEAIAAPDFAVPNSTAPNFTAPNPAMQLQVASPHTIIATAAVQHGVGVGEGSRYQSAEQMGFQRFNRDIHLQTPNQISLQPSAVPSTADRTIPAGKFLSVMSASSCTEEAEIRRATYPDAVVEEMETYSVALACHTSGVPLIAIRGISNVAGDRDFKNWNSKAAIQAASDVLLDYLS